MSSNNSDKFPDGDLQPAHGLWQQYAPEEAPYRFQARTATEARRWQTETRRALNETLGFQSTAPVPLSPETVERVDRGDYVREKLLLRTAPHALMPVYVLTPKKAPRPLPVVIAFHGHGYGVKDIVGLKDAVYALGTNNQIMCSSNTLTDSLTPDSGWVLLPYFNIYDIDTDNEVLYCATYAGIYYYEPESSLYRVIYNLPRIHYEYVFVIDNALITVSENSIYSLPLEFRD